MPRTLSAARTRPESPRGGSGRVAFCRRLHGAPLAPIVPSTEPTVLIAGDTAKWTTSHADFPVSDGWVFTYSFRGPSSLDHQCTPGSADYAATLDAAKTALLAAGVYQWVLEAAKAGERYTVRRGQLTLVADVAAADAGDLTAFPEKVLPLVEQEIYNRLNGQRSIERYSIGGRTFDKIPIAELFTLRGQLRAQVAAARNAGKLGIPIGAVFARPSA